MIIVHGPSGVGKTAILQRFMQTMLPNSYIPIDCAFLGENDDLISYIQASIVKFFLSKGKSKREMPFWKSVKSDRTIEELANFLLSSTDANTEIMLFIDHIDCLSLPKPVLSQLLQLRHLSRRPKLTIIITTLTVPTQPSITTFSHIISMSRYSEEEIIQLMIMKRSTSNGWASLCREATPYLISSTSSYPAIYAGLCSVWMLCTGSVVIECDTAVSGLASNMVRKACLLLAQHGCYHLSLHDPRFESLRKQFISAPVSVIKQQFTSLKPLAKYPKQEQVLIIAAFLCTEHLKKEDKNYDFAAIQQGGPRKKRPRKSLEHGSGEETQSTATTQKHEERQYERLFTAERLLAKYNVIVSHIMLTESGKRLISGQEKFEPGTRVQLLSLIGRLVSKGFLTVVPVNRNVQQWINQVQYKSNITLSLARQASELVGFDNLETQLKHEVYEAFTK